MENETKKGKEEKEGSRTSLVISIVKIPLQCRDMGSFLVQELRSYIRR